MPIGRGYDCGLRVAVEICKLMDRNPDMSMSDLRKAPPVTYATPTMSPYCADEEKYDVLARIVTKLEARTEAGWNLAGRSIKQVVTVNGARLILDNVSWGLVRACSGQFKHTKLGRCVRKRRERCGNARDFRRS